MESITVSRNCLFSIQRWICRRKWELKVVFQWIEMITPERLSSWSTLFKNSFSWINRIGHLYTNQTSARTRSSKWQRNRFEQMAQLARFLLEAENKHSSTTTVTLHQLFKIAPSHWMRHTNVLIYVESEMKLYTAQQYHTQKTTWPLIVTCICSLSTQFALVCKSYCGLLGVHVSDFGFNHL